MPLSDNIILFQQSSVARKIAYYSILNGILYSTFQFGEVIARKSLGASAFQVMLLTMVMPLGSFSVIWWASLLSVRDQSKILYLTGIPTLLMIASGVFLKDVNHLIGIFIFYYLMSYIHETALNRTYQQHITSNKIGVLYGVSQGFRMTVAAVFSFGAGWWLERFEGGWRHIFFAVSIIGAVSLYFLASVKNRFSDDKQSLQFEKVVFSPMSNVLELLKRRPDFFRFEVAFMIYGIAFLMLTPVVPLFLVDDLKLGYDAIGFAKGTMFQLVMIIGIPLFGNWFDKTTPHRLTAIVFAGLALFPVLLILAKYVDESLRMGVLIVAFAVFGIAMSGVSVSWSLSAIRFAGKIEDVAVYQSIHIAATGIRGLIAPFLGYSVMTLFGKDTALLTASALWLISAGAMILARCYDMRRGEAFSLRA
jgi:MFS family permease